MTGASVWKGVRWDWPSLDPDCVKCKILEGNQNYEGRMDKLAKRIEEILESHRRPVSIIAVEDAPQVRRYRVHPKHYELDDDIMNLARNNAKTFGGSVNVSNDIEEAYDDADVVYVKSWGSLEHYGNAKDEKQMRISHRDSWRIKNEYLDYTKKDSIFMHCLPIRRNIVADDSVVDGKHSVVYDQAENRLYTAKALLYYLLKE